MIASTQDLPLNGNYFAECDYLSQDLKSGTIANRAGARILALTDDFLIAVHNSLEAQLGEKAVAVLAQFTRDWGRRAAEQFSAEIENHHGKPLTQLPLGLFAADLAEAFEKALAEKGRPTIIDIVATRDPAAMLPGIDARALKMKPGDRPV